MTADCDPIIIVRSGPMAVLCTCDRGKRNLWLHSGPKTVKSQPYGRGHVVWP